MDLKKANMSTLNKNTPIFGGCANIANTMFKVHCVAMYIDKFMFMLSLLFSYRYVLKLLV